MNDNHFIITREENDYDQWGEYFVAWFSKKPTKEQLRALKIDHFGRKKEEQTWYNLRQVNEGENFDER
jgi:hypothetical protein